MPYQSLCIDSKHVLEPRCAGLDVTTIARQMRIAKSTVYNILSTSSGMRQQT